MQLTPQEIQLLQTPLAEMEKNERAMALIAWERRNSINWAENETHREKQKAAHKARFKDAA